MHGHARRALGQLTYSTSVALTSIQPFSAVFADRFPKLETLGYHFNDD